MHGTELQTAKEIALEAGDIILKYFDGEQRIELKEDFSPVTKADKLVNRMVIERLSEYFPEDGIIGEEESTAEYGMGRKWICDPIDGTVAFVWGLPTSMFSLALVIDGKPHVAVTYDPYLKRLYTSIINKGSFCNSKKLSVSNKTLKRGHVATTGSPERIKQLKFIEDLQNKGAYIATYSGCVHKSCQVARGKFEGYIETGVSGYDMAAVDLIVREAGGNVTSLTGEKLDFSKAFTGAVISNGLVHDELINSLKI